MLKIIFDHLPKCGGTSVRRLLAACVGENRLAPPLELVSVGHALRLFERYDVITGHFHGQVLVHAHPDVRYITLLRHPVERVVSAYYFFHSLEFDGSTHAHVLAARSMTLREYVSQDGGAALDALANNMTHHFAAARGAHVGSEDLLAAALANIMRYDVVGVVEDMPAFVARLCARFGWKPPGGDFVENRTPERPALDSLDPDVRDVIESRNNLDLALYETVASMLARRAGIAAPAPGDVGDRDARYYATCSLRFLTANGYANPRVNVASGERVRIRAELGVPADTAGALLVVLYVRDLAGEVVYSTNGQLSVAGEAAGGFVAVPVHLDLNMRLGEGHYTLDLCIEGGDRAGRSVGVVQRDWLQIDVSGHKGRWFTGIADLEAGIGL